MLKFYSVQMTELHAHPKKKLDIKGWFQSACAKHRIMLPILMAITLFFVIAGLINLIQDRNYGLPFNKMNEIRIGMTESELTRIMGKPSGKVTLTTGDESFLWPSQTQKVKETIEKYGPIIECFYGRRLFGSTGVLSIEGIFLDHEHKTVVLLEVFPALYEDPTGNRELVLLMVTCTGLAWVSSRILCRRFQRRTDSRLDKGLPLEMK